MAKQLEEKELTFLNDEQLKNRFRELLRKFGRSNTKIAEALNHESIASPRGKEWKSQNVFNYLNRHPDLISHDVPNEKVDQKSASQEDTKTEESALKGIDLESLTALVEIYQTGKLQEIIDWVDNQRTHKEVKASVLDRRPMFKGEVKNTGVGINKELLRLAREKVRTEPQRVGKSISQLVEFLIWEYLGSPMGIVVGSSEEHS